METLMCQEIVEILKGYTLCVCGFHTEERMIMKGMIEFWGGNFCEYVDSRSTTFVISDNPLSYRVCTAKKYGIPVITSQWLFDSIAEHRILSINKYILQY